MALLLRKKENIILGYINRAYSLHITQRNYTALLSAQQASNKPCTHCKKEVGLERSSPESNKNGQSRRQNLQGETEITRFSVRKKRWTEK